MSEDEMLNKMALIFEHLHGIAIEGMPNEVDFTAKAYHMDELFGLAMEAGGEIPLSVSMEYKGYSVTFEATLTAKALLRPEGDLP